MFSVHERLIISSHCGIFPSWYMVERMSDRLFSMEKKEPLRRVMRSSQSAA